MTIYFIDSLCGCVRNYVIVLLLKGNRSESECECVLRVKVWHNLCSDGAQFKNTDFWLVKLCNFWSIEVSEAFDSFCFQSGLIKVNKVVTCQSAEDRKRNVELFGAFGGHRLLFFSLTVQFLYIGHFFSRYIQRGFLHIRALITTFW